LIEIGNGGTDSKACVLYGGQGKYWPMLTEEDDKKKASFLSMSTYRKQSIWWSIMKITRTDT
jgi:hypothetical protein